METGLADILEIGSAVVVLGLTVLLLMVHRELGPFAGLAAGGRWLLSAAFGMGIMAFALKLAVAVVIASQPAMLHAELPGAMDRGETTALHNPAAPLPGRYVWEPLPTTAPAPADNPTTPQKVALGRQLFQEKRLSGDGTLACTSCHDLLGHAGADGRPTASGARHQVGDRNTPTVWNAAFQSVLFWDGRAPSLEAQATGPILNPIEMALPSPAVAERRLSADPAYRAAFAAAFGDETVTFARIAQAIAAYERTLVAADTPYDRFVRGDGTALSPAQLRGMALFESVGCVLCHRGPNFSDASLLGGQNPYRFFPANATPFEAKYKLLREDGSRGVWRVPSLRNVALTGPWLHNGSIDRLEEVVRIMAGAQLGRSEAFIAWLGDDSGLGRIDRSPLADRDVRDLVAFLEALSSDALRTEPSGGR